MKSKALAVESGPGFFLLLVFVFWMVHPLGAGIGLLLGLVSGSFVHQEEPLIVASVYQVEPGKLLKKLRSVAKDPEYR